MNQVMQPSKIDQNFYCCHCKCSSCSAIHHNALPLFSFEYIWDSGIGWLISWRKCIEKVIATEVKLIVGLCAEGVGGSGTKVKLEYKLPKSPIL